MINWILTNALPKNFPSEVSQKLQTLWCQRQQLQIGQDGIQYRLWEDVRGGGSNPELQIVYTSLGNSFYCPNTAT